MARSNSSFQIMRSPDFDILFASLAVGEKSKRAFAAINEKKFTVKDSDITYRVINHWTEKGLLNDARADGSLGWRKFSLKDLLWLRILRELREFGLPLDKLKKTHRTLVQKNPEPVLEVAIGMCLKRYPVFLVVMNDGQADIANQPSIEFTDELHGYRPFIRINLNTIFREIMGDRTGKYAPLGHASFQLDGTEMDMLESIHDQNSDSVNVIKKDGNIARIETRKKVEGAARIVDLLNETGFGEVTVKVENGKPVHTEILKKRKLK